jgi:hypothetical protein
MSKIIVTIGAIVLFLFLFGILIASQKGTGNSGPGIIGFILFGGLIAGLKSIWKKPESPSKENDDDNFKLDKFN